MFVARPGAGYDVHHSRAVRQEHPIGHGGTVHHHSHSGALPELRLLAQAQALHMA